MFLAEALAKRKKLVNEITELQNTALLNVWADADSGDGEDEPEIELIGSLRVALRDLVYQINMTNSSCEMTKLLSQRDFLKAEIKWLTNLTTSAATDQEQRYQSSKNKRQRRVNLPAVRLDLSMAQNALTDLESEINRLNWTIELKELP